MTTYERTKKPVQKTDIQVGDKVVIHGMEVNEKVTAHTIELGAAKPAAR